MAVLNLFPARIAVGYANVGGQQVPIFASPEFIRALGAVFDRLGGANGPSVDDLSKADGVDSGIEEFRSEQWKHNDGVDMAPPVVCPTFDDPLTPPMVFPTPFEDPMNPLPQEHAAIQPLLTELAGLREEVACLRQMINDILQGTML